MIDETHRSGPSAPSLAVDPHCHAPAGERGVLRVHVRNVATVSQSFNVTVLGLEQVWSPAPVSVTRVDPGATVTVEIPISPVAGTTPGEYPFVVAAEARTVGGQHDEVAAKTVQSASLVVDNRSDVVLSVEPADARGVFGRGVQVVVANAGYSRAEVGLTAAPEKGLNVSLDRSQVQLGPHQTVRVRGKVRARRPRFMGHNDRRSYVVTATGTLAPQRFQANFHSKPMLSGGALKVLGLVMVAVLWVGSTIAVLPWISSKVRSSTVASSASSAPATPGETAEAGAGEGEEPSGADGSGANAPGGAAGSETGKSGQPGKKKGKSGKKKEADKKGNGADNAAPTVRISGAVAGKNPADVTVEVSPASALEADQEDNSEGPDDRARTDAAGSTTTPAVALAGSALLGLTSNHVAAVTSTAAVRSVVASRMARTSAAPAGKVWGTALPVETVGTPTQSRSTSTGDDGTWAVAGLSPTGRYLVTLSKPGYQTQRYLVTGATAASTPIESTLVPGEGNLHGTVTGPQGHTGGVSLTISDGTTTVTTRSATRGHVGSWSVTGLATPSTYLVTASSDRLGAQSQLVHLAASGTATVDLTLQRGVAELHGTVTGTARSGAYRGLGGLTVTATDGTTTRTASTTTGESRSGTFSLPDLPVPGTYTVTVEGDGYLTQVRKVHLTAKRSGTAIKIQTRSDGGNVTGNVRDEDGKGLGGAGLVLSNEDHTYKTMSSSDGAGSFRLEGIAPGTYVLSGQVFGHEMDFSKVKVTYGGTTKAALVLTSIPGNGLVSTSHIRGRVTDATGGGVITCPHIRADEKCRVTASTKATELDGSTHTVQTKADPDEQYLLPASSDGTGLLPGRYDVTLRAPGYEDATVSVDVPMGAIADAATVALQPSPSITGNVQARVGTLPQGVCVMAIAEGVTLDAQATCQISGDECSVTPATDGAYCGAVDTTKMGAYEMTRLPAGTYTVWTTPPSNSEYVSDAPDRPDGSGGVTISLKPGDVKRYDPTLDRLGRVSLTIEASAGNGTRTPAHQALVKVMPEGSTNVTTTGHTDENGLVSFTGLEPGSYTFEATLGTVSGALTSVHVGLNQEVNSSLVMTSGVASFAPKVVYQLDAGGGTPVADASVTVTGTTGYHGSSPTRTSAETVTTSNSGVFTVCTDATGCQPGSHVTELPLVEDHVDISITADGFDDYTATDVPTSDLATITLTPTGVHFDGKVKLVGLSDPLPATTADQLRHVRYSVEKVPPGAGNVSLKTSEKPMPDPAVAENTVVWSDSTQPTDGDGRMLRPGSYEVRASLDGFDSDTQTFTVEAGEDMDEVVFKLKKFGMLRVDAVTAGTSQGITNTVMKLTLSDGTTRTIEADEGNDYVDFGTLPTGDYPVQIRAAGYKTTTEVVEVAPGQGTDSPESVEMPRLSAVTGTVVGQLGDGWTEELPGAQVTAKLASSTTSFHSTSDDDGSFRVTGTKSADGLIDGTWKISASKAGYKEPAAAEDGTASTSMTLPGTNGEGTADMDFPVDTDGHVLTLTPKPGTLNVSVLDENLDPITDDVTATLTYNDGTHPPLSMTPTCSQDASDCPGVYQFSDLKPLTYTLNLWSSGRAPVSMSVTIAPGEPTTISVQLTQPAGTIQGVVSMQSPAGSPPVDDAEVVLKTDPGGTVVETKHTSSNGAYSMPSVAPGTYTIVASKGGKSVSRSIVITAAQNVTVDLTIVVQTQPVTVTLTSSHGYDLTGALVSMTEDISGGGTPMTLAPQPAIRSGSTFAVTFAQVPAASWTVTVSGPTGHFGQTTASVTTNDTSPGSLSITVDETQLRLQGDSDLPSSSVAPSTLTAVVEQDGDDHDVTVPVGGEAVVYVPNVEATVTGHAAEGWKVVTTPGDGKVPADAVSAVVRLTISRTSTTTTITTSSNPTVVLDSDLATEGSLDLDFTVTASAGEVTGGTVTAWVKGLTGGFAVTSGTASVTGSGTTSITVPVAAGSPPGQYHVRLAYEGPSDQAWKDSTSDAMSFTVVQGTEASASYDSNAETVTGSVTPGEAAGHGTLSLQVTTSTSSHPTWHTLSGCTATSSQVTLTCAATAATEVQQVRAHWEGADGYGDDTSDAVTIDAAPPTHP